MTTPRKPKRTAAESAQHYRAEAERHARRAWLDEHVIVADAAKLAEACTRLAARVGAHPRNADLVDALHQAAHDIDEKCEHVIQAGLAGVARGSEKGSVGE